MLKDIIRLQYFHAIAKYKNCHNKREILLHEFGKNNECEIFGRMECNQLDISGIASQIFNNTLNTKKIEDFLQILERSSIFADECIVLWIKLYSEEFSEYFDYMQSVETLRSACLVYLNNFKSDK